MNQSRALEDLIGILELESGDAELRANQKNGGGIAFDGAELAALVVASEADRLWHPEFLGLCFEKWRSTEFRVRDHEVLAGANPDTSVTWTLAQVLERLGATLECVVFDADVREERARVAQGLHAAA